ncbi:MAG: hypothetical protein KDB01_25640 [Planctomycetaceae bacterium]|nr:hypothetical protein [Planctomycetaceae bacterium]
MSMKSFSNSAMPERMDSSTFAAGVHRPNRRVAAWERMGATQIHIDGGAGGFTREGDSDVRVTRS